MEYKLYIWNINIVGPNIDFWWPYGPTLEISTLGQKGGK